MQTDSKLKLALFEALERDFSEIEEFEKINDEYQFSQRFEVEMQKIIKLAGNHYVSVRQYRLRRAVVVALIVALMMVTAVGVVGIVKPLVKWITEQNEKQGTLDIVFDVEDSESKDIEFSYIQPDTPEGYEIIREDKYGIGYDIDYRNEQGEVIYYSQLGALDSMSMSMDNEDDSLQEVTINGYDGYAWEKSGNRALYWSDGMYFFQLIGTCNMTTLEELAKTIY